MNVCIRPRYCRVFSSKFFIHEDRRPRPRLAPCLQVCAACQGLLRFLRLAVTRFRAADQIVMFFPSLFVISGHRSIS